ncbi:MAG: hypothetical protein ACI9K1_000691, partial [Arcticibacterium sp.]
MLEVGLIVICEDLNNKILDRKFESYNNHGVVRADACSLHLTARSG